MPLYAVETPKGKLVEESVGLSVNDSWDFFINSGNYPKKALSLVDDEADELIDYDDAAKTLGYKAVRVYLTKQNPRLGANGAQS